MPPKVLESPAFLGGVVARPPSVLIGRLPDARLRIVKAIPVRVESQQADVVVASDELDEFGEGDHLTAALDDFGRALSSLYWSLKADQQRLGADLYQTWRRLQTHLVEHGPHR